MNETIAYLKRTEPGEGKLVQELEDSDQPFCLPFLEDVSIFFLFDKGDSYCLAQEKHFQSQDLSQDAILDIAISNLKKQRQELIEITNHENVFLFSGSGNLEASLLLIPELWDIGLKEYFPNGCVAAIPARDELAVCDKYNKEGMNYLRGVVEKVWPIGDHVLTKSLLLRENSKWAKYDPA